MRNTVVFQPNNVSAYIQSCMKAGKINKGKLSEYICFSSCKTAQQNL